MRSFSIIFTPSMDVMAEVCGALSRSDRLNAHIENSGTYDPLDYDGVEFSSIEALPKKPLAFVIQPQTETDAAANEIAGHVHELLSTMAGKTVTHTMYIPDDRCSERQVHRFFVAPIVQP